MKPPLRVEIMPMYRGYSPENPLANVFLVRVTKGGHFPENTTEELRLANSKELLKYLRGLYKETPGEAE